MTTWMLLAPLWFENVIVLGHCCNEYECGAVAAWRCFCRGATAAKCTRHRDWTAKIAEVMGFTLHSEPLEVRQWPEPDPSAARFAAMELT